MKKRNFLAALLAVSCAASLSVTAFAEPAVPDDISDEAKQAVEDAIAAGGGLVIDGGTVGGIDIEATVEKPTIAVVLPKKVEVFVNPYRAEVKTGEDSEGNEIKSIDTVVSPELTVVNGSNCAVKVSVKGQFVTYKYASTAPTGTAIEEDPQTDENGVKITGWDTFGGSPLAEQKLYPEGNSYYVKVNVGTAESPEYQYRAAAVKVTAANATKHTPASYAITGYATTSIKVAAAAVKEDTDKTNSIFMYVEGTDKAGVYPAAYAKTVAGLDAKGNLNVGGQYALTAKEGSGAVLYLGGNGTTGYMRVTGSAATAPTTTWTEIEETEGFETPFVFIVDPVANAAENPVLKTMTAATGTLTPALTATNFTYNLSVPAGTTSVVLNVTSDDKIACPTTGSGDGTVVTKAAYSTGKVTLTISGTAAAKAKGTAKFTVTSEHGKVNTYTINVTIV